MRNPYSLHKGDSLGSILLEEMVFPGAAFAHVCQRNRELDLSFRARMNNYLYVSLAEVFKLAACGMATHNGYELYQCLSSFS